MPGVLIHRVFPAMSRLPRQHKSKRRPYGEVTQPTLRNRRMKPMDGRAFSPDGRLLVDWAENPLGRSRMDDVYVWDAATGRAVATLAAGPRPGATNAAFAPDGR